jgi:hypothetical protein
MVGNNHPAIWLHLLRNDVSSVYASSNGNLQFTSRNPSFSSSCLERGPATGMGDMLAPYWDDLNLTFVGLLETEPGLDRLHYLKHVPNG